MEANIKPLSKEVTVMTMEDMDMDSHSTAFVVGDKILNQSHNYLINCCKCSSGSNTVLP